MSGGKAHFRGAIERDAHDLRQLAARIAATNADRQGCGLSALAIDRSVSFTEQERQLDQAAWQLRRAWLRMAHRPADASMKSPCAGQGAHVASGANVDFGYERDLDVSLLERRRGTGRTGYMQDASGWSSDLVLFRSGQAALAGLLQLALQRWGTARTLRVRHLGAYFETAALLQSWPDRVLAQVSSQADIVIAEPVFCDGQFGSTGDLDGPGYALLLDTTMVGPSHDLRQYLDGSFPLVIAYHSGLKLDQAGLELANVGIVRIYARNDDAQEDAAEIAAALRHLRGLTATGLTLDELSALSAPWFMDRAYADAYTDALFANNRALAAAIGNHGGVFRERCHPSLACPGADAPFCAIELCDPSPDRYDKLLKVVQREVARRGLLAQQGGSFGFRGHRFELIEPAPEQGRPFLRVALGWRDGFSRHGLCELFEQLSARGFDR